MTHIIHLGYKKTHIKRFIFLRGTFGFACGVKFVPLILPSDHIVLYHYMLW